MEMLRAADVREDIDEYASPLDELFERLEMRDPEHIAVKYYKDYHSGSAKTLKSIQITLAALLREIQSVLSCGADRCGRVGFAQLRRKESGVVRADTR